MDIKVLGSGCAKCKTLEKVTREAVEQLNLDATIEKVEDIQKIIEYGVMITPALVVDGEVVLKGSVPKVDKLKVLLSKQ
jgi:small redox-active disulfide protein 2